MIRPITLVCTMLALGSGLYLYHAKHEVEEMDKKMAKIAKDTAAIRADSRHLMDQWIGLGEPGVLKKYSDEFLGLKGVMPTQFVRMADLASRLPPPGMAAPEGATDDAGDEMVANGAANGAAPENATLVVPVGVDAGKAEPEPQTAAPVPPVRLAPPLVQGVKNDVPGPKSATAPKVAAMKPPAPTVPQPVVAQPVASPSAAQLAGQPQSQPVGQPVGQPAAVAKQDPRPRVPLQAAVAPVPASVAAAPRPFVPAPTARPAAPVQAASLPPVQPRPQDQARQPVQAQPAAAPASAPSSASWAANQPMVRQGSLLGMSHGNVPAPVPLPTPVSATWPAR